MDVAAYGLSRNPFERNFELDEACLPNPLAVRLSELQAGLGAPQGVSVLIGERGSGKSVLARILARRLAGNARAALIVSPGPSLAEVLGESLAQLGGESEEVEARDESSRLHQLAVLVQRRARAGSATAIVIDDAQRLSPQVLARLSRLFPEECDEPLRFHVFLIGRPELLDRMNASSDRQLLEHLLQICRIEPLGLRDSVRYLERRLAACGGELVRLFEGEAIDEIVARANGRLLVLEALAAAAFNNAARSGAPRVMAAHVEKTPPGLRPEENPMALKQQSLRFDMADANARDDSIEWGDDGSDDGWIAGDEPDVEETELSWETSASDEDGTEEDEAGQAATPQAPLPRRGLVAMALVTATVFAVLTWAANRLPGESATRPSGRDALLFAQPLTSQPREILRLADSAEQADAAAHVVSWSQARTIAAATNDADAHASEQGAATEPQHRAGHDQAEVAGAAADAGAAVAASDSPALPAAQAATAGAAAAAVQAASAKVVAAAPAASAQDKPAVVVAKAQASVQNSTRTSKPVPQSPQRVSGKRATAPVYTVQIGAFRTRRNAQDLISKLGPRLRTARILNEGGFYRVVSGAFESKGAAVAHEGSLRRAGLTTYVRTAVF